MARTSWAALPRRYARRTSKLAERLDDQPVAGTDGTVFRQLTRALLYSDDVFPQLAQTWQGLDRGDAAAVRKARGYAALPVLDENFFSATLAVQCGDVPWPTELSQYQRDVATDSKRYPLVGAMTANMTPCARWPLAPKEEPTRITDDGPSKALVLQNLRDPATIYTGGVQMRKQLGDRGRLVTVDQGGHGAYLAGNACADNLTTQYLVNGTLPARDQYCSADTDRRRDERRLTYLRHLQHPV